MKGIRVIQSRAPAVSSRPLRARDEARLQTGTTDSTCPISTYARRTQKMIMDVGLIRLLTESLPYSAKRGVMINVPLETAT